MRAVSLSNKNVNSILNRHFVNTFTDTTGDPTAGTSFQHSPNDSPGNCIRGNGKQNVQTIFMTPAGEIFHVATGYLDPQDLYDEIEFAGELFQAMQKDPDSSVELVQTAHGRRLEQAGFNDQEINSQSPFDLIAGMQNGRLDGNSIDSMLGSGSRGSNSSSGRSSGSNPFESMIRSQFLSDNKFPIKNPLMSFETLEADPTPLVGNGQSFFGSSSNSSNMNR